jgi:hypothetical protein
MVPQPATKNAQTQPSHIGKRLDLEVKHSTVCKSDNIVIQKTNQRAKAGSVEVNRLPT